MKEMLASVQVAIALTALVLLFILTTYVVKRETLTSSGLTAVVKQDALLVKPPTRSPITFGTTLTTHPSKADKVVELQPSRNQSGGDEFTLSFTLKLADLQAKTSRCLLLWGSPQYVDFVTADKSSHLRHLLIFMPMIYLHCVPDPNNPSITKHQLHVHFNCTNTVLRSAVVDLDNTKNLIDLLEGVLVTVTFSDYNINMQSHGCECCVYLNTTLAQIEKVERQTIRRSPGLLYILPSLNLVQGLNDLITSKDETVSNAILADISYHNYVLPVSKMMLKVKNKMHYTTASEMGESVRYDASRDRSWMDQAFLQA